MIEETYRSSEMSSLKRKFSFQESSKLKVKVRSQRTLI